MTMSSPSPLFLALTAGAILVGVISGLVVLGVALFVRPDEMTHEPLLLDWLRGIVGHKPHFRSAASAAANSAAAHHVGPSETDRD